MKPINLLLVGLLQTPPLANAHLVELVTIRGPQGGAGFYHVCGPGDVNDDGYPEFIASSMYYKDPGRACVTIYTTNTTPVSGSDPLPQVREIQLTCYPNPFNTNTLIRYSLSIRTHVKLELFNLAGQKVASLVDEIQSSGRKSIMWEGLDDRGQPVSSGIYFCKISCNNLTKTEKIALLR